MVRAKACVGPQVQRGAGLDVRRDGCREFLLVRRQLSSGLWVSLPAGLTAVACRLWFEQCAFTDQQNSGTCPRPYKQPCEWGQRPTVIMRGLWSSRDADMQLVDKQGPVPGVYLVRFDTVIFTGGGVQCE